MTIGRALCRRFIPVMHEVSVEGVELRIIHKEVLLII